MHLRLSRTSVRWLVLLGLLALAWLTTPHPVPLYDGIGFPDEPYRYVTGAKAPTPATVTLPVKDGVNSGGLIANSAEVGPQVSLYAPPRAFAVAGTAPVVVTAKAVPVAPPLPAGTIDSNVYDVTFTSTGGPVKLVTEAQPPAITMRSASATPKDSGLQYRSAPSAAWRELPTRQVGRDVFNASVPGAGQYVLVEKRGPAAPPAKSRGPLYAVLGATVLLMAAVLVGVRLLSRRAEES